MASTAAHLPLTFRSATLSCLVFLSLFVAVSARPCKTLFISAFSFSVPQNPNRPIHILHRRPTSGYITVFTEIAQENRVPAARLGDLSIPFFERPHFLSFDAEIQPQYPQPHKQRVAPLWLSSASTSYDFTSLRDRTKDILSVVVALLFGVGCGALTAATMYLAWSLFSGRFGYRNSYDDFYDDGSSTDDNASPKKMGYVKIPAADPVEAKPEKEGV